jgi:hypothetical protein
LYIGKHRKSAILRENAVIALKNGKRLSINPKSCIYSFIDSMDFERGKALRGPAMICLFSHAPILRTYPD